MPVQFTFSLFRIPLQNIIISKTPRHFYYFIFQNPRSSAGTFTYLMTIYILITFLASPPIHSMVINSLSHRADRWQADPLRLQIMKGWMDSVWWLLLGTRFTSHCAFQKIFPKSDGYNKNTDWIGRIISSACFEEAAFGYSRSRKKVKNKH
jgi:hypothetical protein